MSSECARDRDDNQNQTDDLFIAE